MNEKQDADASAGSYSHFTQITVDIFVFKVSPKSLTLTQQRREKVDHAANVDPEGSTNTEVEQRVHDTKSPLDGQ